MRFWMVAPLVAAVMAMSSCAQREDEDVNRIEQMALDAWIEKHVIGKGIEVVRQSNGMWVEFIEDGDQTIDSGRDTVVWYQLNYTATDVDNNVFTTRDSIEALKQRTFTPYTYYIPEYAVYDPSNIHGTAGGMHFALTRDMVKPDGSTMKMSEGSRVKLYIPSFLALGTTTYSNDQGYGGQYPLEGSRIVITDLAVKGVVKNPLKNEEAIVEKYAIEQWGLTKRDTIATGFYVDTLNFQQIAELENEFPGKPWKKEYGIEADSTVNVWFIGRFLPTEEYPHGFIFDTNIPSVHDKFYNRRRNENYVAETKTFSVFSYTPKEDQNKHIAAWFRAIPALRKGQWSRVVFPSSYAWGGVGLSKAIKKQQAQYSQLMQLYSYSSMYSGYGSYGSYGGYGGYDDGTYGYNPYYDPYNSFYGYSTSGIADEEDEQTVVTEILPYTPVMFEIYIEAEHDED